MMRKSEYALWTLLVLAVLAAGSTMVGLARSETASAANSEIYRQLDLFGEVLERVRADYVEKPEDAKLIESAINGMLMALDPHSAYLNPKHFRDMQVQTRGEFGGLGIEVTMENGVVKVVAPIEDTPASKAGIQSGDLITALDKEQIQGLTLQEAVEKMRGPVNSAITLTVVRKGVDDPFDVKVVRDVIHINPVKYSVENDVGYIRVTTFNEQTTANLQKAIEDLKKEIGPKLKGFVIDLRNNPGGLLDQAISVSDTFLDQGAIVLTKGRNLEETQRSNARPRRRKSLPARCRTTIARPSSARGPSARARCRPSFRSDQTARSGSPRRATTRRRAARFRPRASSPRWWSRRSCPPT